PLAALASTEAVCDPTSRPRSPRRRWSGDRFLIGSCSDNSACAPELGCVMPLDGLARRKRHDDSRALSGHGWSKGRCIRAAPGRRLLQCECETAVGDVVCEREAMGVLPDEANE